MKSDGIPWESTMTDVSEVTINICNTIICLRFIHTKTRRKQNKRKEIESLANSRLAFSSYKNNYHMECIRRGNARHKVINFWKSHPFNWLLECILKTITTKQKHARSTTMTTRLHDTSLKGASIVESSRSL